VSNGSMIRTLFFRAGDLGGGVGARRTTGGRNAAVSKSWDVVRDHSLADCGMLTVRLCAGFVVRRRRLGRRVSGCWSVWPAACW
jgi:hypothetical protein